MVLHCGFYLWIIIYLAKSIFSFWEMMAFSGVSLDVSLQFMYLVCTFSWTSVWDIASLHLQIAILFFFLFCPFFSLLFSLFWWLGDSRQANWLWGTPLDFILRLDNDFKICYPACAWQEFLRLWKLFAWQR